MKRSFFKEQQRSAFKASDLRNVKAADIFLD
jgi:hypothetical protein